MFIHQHCLYLILTNLVAVERPLELGGASGHAADGHGQHSLHQQGQGARVLDRLHAHLQPSGMTLCLEGSARLGVRRLPGLPTGLFTDLSQLEDASRADVFSRMQLHRGVLPLLIQLLDGDPQLNPARYLVPP